MTPASVPSAIANLTSSSVTLWPRPFRDAQERQQAPPSERSSSQTSGRKIEAMICSGRATRTAIGFGRGERDALGHEFADDHRQRGDADHDEHDGDLGAVGSNARDAVEHRAEPHAERGAAEGARQDADQRDADLHRGQEAAGIVGQRQRLRGAAVALLGHVLQPDAAGRHHRHFGQREEAVQQDQTDDDREFEPRCP